VFTHAQDTARLFPPEAPGEGAPPTSFLYRLLRPEFVREYERPLSSDAFSKFGEDEHHAHNQEVIFQLPPLLSAAVAAAVARECSSCAHTLRPGEERYGEAEAGRHSPLRRGVGVERGVGRVLALSRRHSGPRYGPAHTAHARRAGKRRSQSWSGQSSIGVASTCAGSRCCSTTYRTRSCALVFSLSSSPAPSR
jgi:hypothetical protein